MFFTTNFLISLLVTSVCEKTSQTPPNIAKIVCLKRSIFLFLIMQHPEASGLGISRNQLHLYSLEDKITSDNPVRFIDAFVSC